MRNTPNLDLHQKQVQQTENSVLKTYFAAILLTCAIAIAMYSTYYASVEKEVCYAFNTEWFDNIAATYKKLQLRFFTEDKTVEMVFLHASLNCKSISLSLLFTLQNAVEYFQVYPIKNYDLQAKKLFLKRSHIPNIDEKDFYIGNTVVILSRPLRITEYANEFTQEEISRQREKTFAMIKPDALNQAGEIIHFIEVNSLQISKMKMTQMSIEEAQQFYEEHSTRHFFQGLVNYITSGPVILMELVGEGSVSKWRDLLGPTDAELARSNAPNSLRAKFGTDKQKNAAHGSDSILSAHREIEFFFAAHQKKQGRPVGRSGSWEAGESTCCVIKPHSVNSGNLGTILSSITTNQFRIKQLEMFHLERPQAEEFLEVYNEVLPEYPRMVQQLVSGPLVALEVVGNQKTTVEDFRNFVGPLDPEIARELRPSSLRAMFGIDKIRNSIHCTDLKEDSSLEVDFFFKLLQQ